MPRLEETPVNQRQVDLNALLVNFNAVDELTGKAYRTFNPPTFLDVQKQSVNIHWQIEEMLTAKDVAKRLWAAVLLTELDSGRAQKVLTELLSDPSLVEIQQQIGYGVLQAPVRMLVADFIEEGVLRGSSYTRLEDLIGWRIAVEHDATHRNTHLANFDLPAFEEILSIKETNENYAQLRHKIVKLAGSNSSAEKFYAAAVLIELCETEEAKAIWTQLETDEKPVFMLSGDIGMRVPAKNVAAQLLGKRRESQSNVTNSENLIDKIFGSRLDKN